MVQADPPVPVPAPDDGPLGVTALLLCGGAGRRLGGADKPLLNWQGQPLVERVAACVRPQVAGILVSANRNLDRYARYGTVVTDRLSGFAGPLAGIASGLRASQTPWLLACPGDAPELPIDLVARLQAGLRNLSDSTRPPAAVAHDGARMQPLPLLLHASVEASLLEYLDSGRRSVLGWLDSLHPAVVDFTDQARAFHSCNGPDDFPGGFQPAICD